jgi:iron complex outermembrane receptor protein
MQLLQLHGRVRRRCVEKARVTQVSLALLAGAMLAGSAGAQGSHATAVDSTGQVEGKVIAEDTGEPLAGVRLFVQGTRRSAVTDALGVFRITEVPVGQAVVVARSLGREPAELAVAVTAGQIAKIDFTLGAVQMAAVVVSATRTTTTLEHMPLHTTVIGSEDLAKAPARTLDQLLREVSGINMAGAPFYTTDPTGHQTKLRGVTSNASVLVLVDGIPIHDPFYGTTQWFKVPLSAIDHVEVVRGGSSSLWGNQAVAGVINIITKRPVDNSGQVDANYGSLNTTIPSVTKNFVLRNGLSLRVSGDLLNTAGYQTTPAQFLNTVPGKAASAATNGNAQVAVYYAPAADFNAFLRAGYHRQNEDIGGYEFGQNLQQSPDAAGGLTKVFSGGSRADVRLWGQYLNFDKYNGAACFLASAANCNTTAVTAPLVQYANSHDQNPYSELGGSAIISSPDATGVLANLQGGVDYRMLSGQDSARTFNKPTTTNMSSATINRINFGKGSQQFIGVFSQLRIVPVQRLETTLSVRYDYWTNQDGIAQMIKYTNGVAGPPIGGPVASSTWGSFDPSLSARLALTEHVSVRGGAYRSFRAPGLNNLYRSYSSATSISIANPDLSPSTLTGGEVGADLKAGILTLGVTVFQDNTKALITTYKVPNAAAAPPAVIAICGPTLSNCPASVNFNTNGQDALARGLEFVGTVRATRSLTLDGSYTYTDSHYTATTTGDPTNVQLGAIPEHLATLGLTWDVTSRWRTYLGFRYNSLMYLDVNQTIRQPAFGLVGLTTSYQVTKRLDLYAAGVNLTDVKYSDSGTTSAPSETLGLGRSVTFGLRSRVF